MRHIPRGAWLSLLFLPALALCACQSSDENDKTLDVDDFVDGIATPNPATAVDATADGRTYRVVRGNNQPDDILTYKYKTSFSVTVTINKNAEDKDVDLAFPVDLNTITPKVEQASGGVVTPPSGGEVEHYDAVVTGVTASSIAAVGGSSSASYTVWYSLPSGGKEALVTLSYAFTDDDDVTFSKNVKVNVNP